MQDDNKNIISARVGTSVSRKRILIVDDEPAILRSTAYLLEAMGFEVLTCSEVNLVLDTISKERPTLLLQDVRMPGLDIDRHVQTVRAHAHGRSMPIVLFTASMDLADVAERVGADATLEKPFKPDELLRVVDTLAPTAA
ncbi:MAG TPA: response regulator [Candidatus Thermoplasmatota archaeon]|nr:response regulator [Candidatus Thermoplasmatota archaeon]